MKKINIVLILVLLANFTFAQELLYFANGNMLKIANFHLKSDSLSFQIHNSSDERVYSINQNELLKMITETGEVYQFNGKSKKTNDGDFSHNIISFNTIAVPAGRFTMSYQIINKTGKLGFEIPVSVGLIPDANIDPLQEIFEIELYSIFYTGFTLNWYPMGQRKVTYLLGPSFRLGIGQSDYYYDYYYDQYPNQNTQQYYSKLLINNGIMISPNKHFSMSVIFSLGIMHRNTRPDDEKFGTVADLSFNLAYKF